MNITFETPTPDDAEALVQVQIRAFHDDTRLYGVELGGPEGYDSVEHMREKTAKHPSHKILLDGKIVGGMVVFDRGGGYYHLDVIFIDPDYHNQGIGTQALQFLDRTYPAKKWTLDTPQYATRNHHFYEKMGYVKVREFEDHGFALIAYEKVM
jgi:GNAT superfamily N-acetyltransferase